MAKDIQEMVRENLINALEDAGRRALEGASKRANGAVPRSSNGGLSGAKGIAAGAGAAALLPVAVKSIGKLGKVLGADGVDGVLKAPGKALEGVTGTVGDRVGSGIGEKITDKVDQAGGPGAILKDTVKGALPFGGGGDSKSSKGGAPGAGKGRRMPVQQSMDIGAPIETVYNQFTQFEDWPNFMHRVTRVTQEDDCTVSFATKIWGKTKEFTAKIETERPEERIKWRVSQGITHTGVVTFHELGPHLTRVMLTMDLQPGGMLEKAARGMRHFKRAARGDLHRFKAFIEMIEHETGAWRGVIEDGKLVEEHDPSYDKKRDYADLAQFMDEADQDDSDQDDSDEDDGAQKSDDKPRARRTSRQPAKSAVATRSTSAKSTGRSGRSSTSRSRNGSSSSASSGRGRASSASSGRGRTASGSSGSRSNGSNGSSSGASRSSGSRRSSAGNTGRRQSQARKSSKS
jgi:uncharacterized membrane protein